MKPTLLLLFSLTLLTSTLVNSADEKPSGLTQVSYKSITELEYAQADEVLKYGEAKQQFVEGWLPIANQHKADIVFVHGGCWLSAYDIAHSRPFTAAFRDAGYRVWSLEYRRAGDEGGGWPNSFLDIQSALKFLKKHKKIAPKKTVLLGHSAGGHLALLAAQQDASFAGIVGLAAIADIKAYAVGTNSCQKVTTQFMGGTLDDLPKEYQAADPKSQQMHNNTWLIYSEQDAIVPATQASDIRDAELIKIEGAGHFDFIHPGSSAYKTILKTIDQALKQK